MLGDMRSFNLNQKFGYVIIPGHSFQFMVTSEEQVECLEHIKHHLIESGVLIIHLDHQDFGWLAGLLDQKEPVYDEGSKVTHPETGKIYRKSSAWSFEPATQTATARTKWEELNQTNDVIQTWEMAPKKLHCVFRFEMEHLLIRAGFIIEAVYGDFYKHPLTDNSGEMIWLARTQ